MGSTKYDKIYTVTSVHHLVPVKLDLTKSNYSHWKRLFTTHCVGFDVSDLILRAPTAEELTSADWIKANAVVSTWIYNTISPSLLERLLNSEFETARDAWVFLEKLFLDNKHAKTMELHAELRGLDMGNLSVEEYFRNIDNIATQLRNLGNTIEDKDLVMSAINGLPDKYSHAKHIIIHRESFPTLETLRSMLTMEEMSLNMSTMNIELPALNSSNPPAPPPNHSSSTNEVPQAEAPGPDNNPPLLLVLILVIPTIMYLLYLGIIHMVLDVGSLHADVGITDIDVDFYFPKNNSVATKGNVNFVVNFTTTGDVEPAPELARFNLSAITTKNHPVVTFANTTFRIVENRAQSMAVSFDTFQTHLPDDAFLIFKKMAEEQTIFWHLHGDFVWHVRKGKLFLFPYAHKHATFRCTVVHKRLPLHERLPLKCNRTLIL